MTPEHSLWVSDASGIICLLFILLMPFGIAGLALINTGLNRTRSASHSILSCLCAASIAMFAFVVIGFSLAGFTGGTSRAIHISGKAWELIGTGRLFARDVQFDGSLASLVLLFQLFAVALLALIPVASGAERWRLSATCVSTAVLAGLIYPLFTHWVWSGGFLSQLGANYGLGHGFVDAGGAATIQLVGGITALAVAWILGPRQGKFTPEGVPTAMPGHNAVLVMFGCLLALVGWIGLTSAGAMLFNGRDASKAVLAVINTVLGASGGALGALVTTRFRFGKPDASLTANGWVCGLVAISASAPFLRLSQAILVGLVAGILVVFAIEVVESMMRVDDPAGAIAVHGAGGLWGILALGMFADLSANKTSPPIDDSGQFLAQLIGAATVLGFVLPLVYGLNLLINRFLPQRVEPLGERQGMDLFELGAGAYPEFVTHREDFLRR